MRKRLYLLLFVVLLATSIMVIMNFYTIKILSASRAYINSESEYSKGQKDAARHLVSYIYTQNELEYLLFKSDMNIPLGNRMARVALLANSDVNYVKIGFLQAKNNPDDINDMVWLFRRFHGDQYFKKIITDREASDVYIDQLSQMANTAHQEISSTKTLKTDKEDMILKINFISDKLALAQQVFSDTLDAACRRVNRYIFIADLLITLIIIGGSVLYAALMIKSLNRSKKLISAQYYQLKAVNEDMDKMVYSVTHDLRSPIVSLTGLVNVLEQEKNINNIHTYTSLMRQSLDNQDKFITEIIASIKSKHNGDMNRSCNLPQIIGEVISQNSFLKGGSRVIFIKDLAVTELHTDPLKLKIILNNLVSNAIKYSDPDKTEQYVKVRSYHDGPRDIIEVEDNGLGIKDQDRSRIFDQFFMKGDAKTSTGIGLFLVKDHVVKLGGTINVRSEPLKGSTFIIRLPVKS